MSLIFILFAVLIGVVIVRGHRRAVAESEAKLRAKFDAQGPAGEAARKLMRDAGYNV